MGAFFVCGVAQTPSGVSGPCLPETYCAYMLASMSALTVINPDDPSELGYPPTLPLEVAMRQAKPADLCAAYGLTRQDWDTLKVNPSFVAAVEHYVDELKKEGVSFKMKARLQAEELLKTSWNMIHGPDDVVPANVKADLIKFTIRAAGLDGSKDQANAGANVGTALQINISL